MTRQKQNQPGEGTSSLSRFFSGYSLSLTLLALFLVSWAGQFISQWIEVRNEAQQHGGTFQFSDFAPAFWQATFENWQSEFLQLLAFVVLTSFLIHRGSPESKDSDEEMRTKLDAIHEELRELRRTKAA